MVFEGLLGLGYAYSGRQIRFGRLEVHRKIDPHGGKMFLRKDPA